MAGGDGANPAPSEPSYAPEGARPGAAVVDAVRKHLGRTSRAPREMPGALTNRAGLPTSLFTAAVDSITRDGPLLLPRGEAVPTPTMARRASVRLPARADGSFEIRDEGTGMAAVVSLAGATDAAAEIEGGLVVYPGGYAGGADVLQKPTPEGTEDYLFFPTDAPRAPEVRYEVELGAAVAGLRLVNGTLELLDAGGAPRLRMAEPYGIDGDGRTIPMNVTVEGCAYDKSPRLPWGRAVTNPGDRHCDVRITWDADVRGPLLVDPSWSTASSMVKPRFHHTASRIKEGRILVVGGDKSDDTPLGSVEIFDPITGTWADTEPLQVPRYQHTANALPDGTVLIIGGRQAGGVALANVDRYDPQTGMWTARAPIPGARYQHASIQVGEPLVVVTGGRNTAPLGDGHKYYWENNIWSDLGLMVVPRAGHTMTPTLFDNLLLAGGETGISGNSPTATAEVLNTDTFAFSPVAAPMAKARVFHVAVPLANSGGKVLVMGGSSSASAEIFDPNVVPPKWVQAGTPNQSRSGATASVLAAPAGMGGAILVAGGAQQNTSTMTAEVFTTGQNQWSSTAEMSIPRAYHTATALPTGQILVTGGFPATNSAEVYPACTSDNVCPGTHYCGKDGICKPRKKELGVACANLGPADCLQEGCAICDTNFCVDGVCCNVSADECNGQCEACDGPNPGTCEPIKGPPHKGHPACTTDGTVCGGQCDGFNPTACDYPSGVLCGKECGDNAIITKSCDGNGKCSQEFPTPCGALQCDPTTTTCVAGCKTNDDCALGSVCNTMSGLCIVVPTTCKKGDDETVILETGMEKSCAPYKCDQVTGACRVVCDSAYDCAGDNICDETGKCAPWKQDDTVTASVDGCACAAPGSQGSPRGAWLLALAAASILAARRRSR